MDFDQCWARVVSATDLKTQTALANFLGIRPSSVAGAKKRGTFPVKWASAIAEKYDLQIGYILRGDELGEDQGVRESGPGYEDTRRSKLILVPRYDVKVSAGHGSVVHSEQIVDHMAFKKEWVLKRGLRADDLVLIEVVGDSMSPNLLEGDLILVNRSVQKVRGDALYVLNFDGNLQVKRIQQLPNGDLVIKSDNPAYEPFRAVGDQVELLTIVGRVVWFGRDI